MASSQYFGVTTTRSGLRPWKAQVNIVGRVMYLGQFETEDRAALAYDNCAFHLNQIKPGRPLRLNFPNDFLPGSAPLPTEATKQALGQYRLRSAVKEGGGNLNYAPPNREDTVAQANKIRGVLASLRHTLHASLAQATEVLSAQEASLARLSESLNSMPEEPITCPQCGQLTGVQNDMTLCCNWQVGAGR